jgi:hypothetical protein
MRIKRTILGICLRRPVFSEHREKRESPQRFNLAEV